MSDVFREVDEEYRQEQLLLFLKRNAPALIAGLVIAIAIAGGVSWYKTDKHHEAEIETMALSEAIDKANTQDGQPADASAILVKAAGNLTGGRRIAAEMAAARYAAEAKDNAGAVKLYKAVTDDHAASPVEKGLAQLEAATLQVDDGDPGILKSDLDRLAKGDSPWRFSARELQAVLAIRLKDYSTARAILSGLAEDANAPEGLKRRAASMAEIAPVADSAQPGK
jgi:hypothetical protein